MLEEANCWKVSGVRTAEDFFRAVSLLVPDATHMFLEGSPDPDIEALLASEADDAEYAAPVGTIWSWTSGSRLERPRNSLHVCPRRRRTMLNLRSAAMSTSIEARKHWCNGLMPF
jgi:hypothetical protein